MKHYITIILILIVQALHSESTPHLNDKGLPTGCRITYHSNGKPASRYIFVDGLVEGEANTWYEDGSLELSAFYVNGLLHGDRSHCAYTVYYPNRTVKKIADFRRGQPFGTYVKYHPNGKKSFQVSYSHGKKQGKEQYFSEDGILCNEIEYDRGMLIKNINQ